MNAQTFTGKLGTVDGEETISKKSTDPLRGTQDTGDQRPSLEERQEHLSAGEQALVRRMEQLKRSLEIDKLEMNRRLDQLEMSRKIDQHETTLSSRNQPAANKSSDWLRCKPTQRYHRGWQVESVTVFKPEIRDLATKKKIAKYLKDRDNSNQARGLLNPTLSPAQIRNNITFADVRLMKAFHLFLNDDSTFIQRSKPAVDPTIGSRHGNLDLILDTPVSSIRSILWSNDFAK